MSKNEMIAEEHANNFIFRLREWQGFALTDYQQKYLRKSFLMAVERASKKEYERGYTDRAYGK